jgi:hypothetical protein
MKIIATSSNKEGMLPMKQSKELEDKKSMAQKNTEVCNFIKCAFCADGIATLVEDNIKFDMYFIVEDSVRGKFAVAYKEIK